MGRRTSALILAMALSGVIVVPLEGQAKKPSGLTFYMNWFGDCAGSGYLALKSVPNPDDCALYFPGLGDTYSFPGSAGLPVKLDATHPITLDFVLTHVAHVAADFEVALTGTVDGEEAEIASGIQTVLAAGPGATPLHYELEPDAALDDELISSLDLNVSWTNGVTYSSIDLQSGTAFVVIHGQKRR